MTACNVQAYLTKDMAFSDIQVSDADCSFDGGYGDFHLFSNIDIRSRGVYYYASGNYAGVDLSYLKVERDNDTRHRVRRTTIRFDLFRKPNFVFVMLGCKGIISFIHRSLLPFTAGVQGGLQNRLYRSAIKYIEDFIDLDIDIWDGASDSVTDNLGFMTGPMQAYANEVASLTHYEISCAISGEYVTVIARQIRLLTVDALSWSTGEQGLTGHDEEESPHFFISLNTPPIVPMVFRVGSNRASDLNPDGQRLDELAVVWDQGDVEGVSSIAAGLVHTTYVKFRRVFRAYMRENF